MPFHAFCSLGQNKQNESDERVVSHLAMAKWLTETTKLQQQISFSRRACGKIFSQFLQ